jgi:hypothetical protein
MTHSSSRSNTAVNSLCMAGPWFYITVVRGPLSNKRLQPAGGCGMMLVTGARG